ncbi:hypothetical protein P7C70_g8801, partial [Phenoliferia sp. Uapishka_3]
MGVRDLGSVVLRHAPSSIIPRTLSSFAGSTFGLDGNLLMSKFHHVPVYISPSSTVPVELLEKHKHVRAWYRFLRALKREGIKPIVVFDGDARVPEKEEENKRRRAGREVQRLRGEAEAFRGERLASLRSTWEELGREDDLGEVSSKADILLAFKEVLDGEERTTILDEKDEKTLQTLVALHADAMGDKENPIYSINQKLVTSEEEIFFENIVQEASMVVEWEEGLSRIKERSDALAESHKKRSLSVPKSAYEETMQLLRALGIPVIKPSTDEPHEAEGLCSTLYSLGHVDYVVSEDTDVTVYGAPLICRFSTARNQSKKFKPKQKRKDGKEPTMRDTMHVLDPVVMQEELKLTKEAFVDFALLLGTDFTERIHSVGPVRALALIREHGSIEAILASEPKYQPSDPVAYLATVVAARRLFINLPPLPPDASLESTAEDPGLKDLLRGWGITGSRSGSRERKASTSGGGEESDGEGSSMDEVDALVGDLRELDLELEREKDRNLMRMAEEAADRMA